MKRSGLVLADGGAGGLQPLSFSEIVSAGYGEDAESLCHGMPHRCGEAAACDYGFVRDRDCGAVRVRTSELFYTRIPLSGGRIAENVPEHLRTRRAGSLIGFDGQLYGDAGRVVHDKRTSLRLDVSTFAPQMVKQSFA